MSSELFSKEEIEYLDDTRFLPAKRRIIIKLEDLLIDTAKGLEGEIVKDIYTINPKYLSRGFKVSKGENYQGLPYLVLDYPGYFDGNDIFSYRVMYWWGNFFSFSLHLSGKLLDKFSVQQLKDKSAKYSGNLYICVNESPWEYHFKQDNYVLLKDSTTPDLEGIIDRNKFLKIAKRATTNEWPQLNHHAIENLRLFTWLTGFTSKA